MAHPKKERTLVVIKPDGIQRTLVGEIIQRYERLGLKLIGMKMCVVNEEHVDRHYNIDPEWRRITGEKRLKEFERSGETPWTTDPYEITGIILEKLKKYMTSGPVIAMVWEGAHAAQLVRKITGGTEPRSSDVGTIRGDFVLDSYLMADLDGRSIRNLVHASGSADEAEKEIALWFRPEELVSYTLIQEKIIYDVNLDSITE